jgi:hypothetical protein
MANCFELSMKNDIHGTSFCRFRCNSVNSVTYSDGCRPSIWWHRSAYIGSQFKWLTSWTSVVHPYRNFSNLCVSSIYILAECQLFNGPLFVRPPVYLRPVVILTYQLEVQAADRLLSPSIKKYSIFQASLLSGNFSIIALHFVWK